MLKLIHSAHRSQFIKRSILQQNEGRERERENSLCYLWISIFFILLLERVRCEKESGKWWRGWWAKNTNLIFNNIINNTTVAAAMWEWKWKAFKLLFVDEKQKKKMKKTKKTSQNIFQFSLLSFHFRCLAPAKC